MVLGRATMTVPDIICSTATNSCIDEVLLAYLLAFRTGGKMEPECSVEV